MNSFGSKPDRHETNYISDILRAMIAQYWQTFPTTSDNWAEYHLTELAEMLRATPAEQSEVLLDLPVLRPLCAMARHCRHQWRCDGPLPGEPPGDCFESKPPRETNQNESTDQTISEQRGPSRRGS
jgi:hypothetical protein